MLSKIKNKARQFYFRQFEKFGEHSDVYMHPIEYGQLQAIMHSIGPRYVIEWGCGGSTKALLRDVPTLEILVSVEHNKAWYNKVKSEVKDSRLRLYYSEPKVLEPHWEPNNEKLQQELEAWCQRCEDERDIMADYIDHPRTHNVEYDIALVDGRARTHCVIEAMKILRHGGVVVLHDAQRVQYHESIRSVGDVKFLEPYVQGQIALIRKP